MKRITSACFLQTMKFDPADNAKPEQELNF